ncbi:MAG: helix-turn-helix transcriptional regulator [Eggerthellaceae bacterium]|nr:helix-turn-helix transcriptional regulator [Eggerthellaceae bacterium]
MGRKKNDSDRSTLRQMRRAAGFTSAKAFADSIGIPLATYVRYEQEHDGPYTCMPIANAWKIADALETTVDAIIGRSEKPFCGKVQGFYDGLSNENKARMDEFMYYLEFLERMGSDLESGFLG